ncbi:MAG TPA: helix-turn-helix domain-containing protein [Allosphingosinicella sp.]|jgi:transcriptional regulator with XRE-family HTH domain
MSGARADADRGLPTSTGRRSLAEKLAELRSIARKPCSAVAEAAGISRQHLWRIEQGIVLSPGPELLARLADVYGLTLAELLCAGPAPTAVRARTVGSDREDILRRLMLCADTMGDDDWQALDALADRASRRVPVPAR